MAEGSSQTSQELMNQVARLQDQVKEIQGIVDKKVPKSNPNEGIAVMDDSTSEGNRYSRLMRFNHASAINGYENISNYTVAIFGLGGIGAVLAEMLCRSGIGKLILFDMKTVDPEHLNRLFFRPEHVGLSKTQAAKASLASLNPLVTVETYSLDVTTHGSDEMIGEKLRSCGVEAGDPVDLVVTCLDNRDARLVINEVRKELGVPWMDASQSPDGLKGSVQFIPDGAKALEFAADLGVGFGDVLPSLASTTSILAGFLCQNAMKHLLGFGVVQRYTGVDTGNTKITHEAPADSNELP